MVAEGHAHQGPVRADLVIPAAGREGGRKEGGERCARAGVYVRVCACVYARACVKERNTEMSR